MKRIIAVLGAVVCLLGSLASFNAFLHLERPAAVSAPLSEFALETGYDYSGDFVIGRGHTVDTLPSNAHCNFVQAYTSKATFSCLWENNGDQLFPYTKADLEISLPYHDGGWEYNKAEYRFEAEPSDWVIFYLFVTLAFLAGGLALLFQASRGIFWHRRQGAT